MQIEVSTMTCCAECGKEGATHKCEYCKGEIYCDTACAKQAWATHQISCNVYDVAKGSSIAVPYMYQDLATENDLRGADMDKLFGQKRILRTVNADCTITPRVQTDFDPIGRVLTAPKIAAAKVEFYRVRPFKYGAKPNTKKFGDMYRIMITQNQWLVPSGEMRTGPERNFIYEDLSMEKDMIYIENKTGSVASKVSKTRRLLGRNAAAYVFNPPRFERPYRLNGRGGNLEVIVETYMSNKPEELISRESMSLNYGDLHGKGRGKLGKITRKFTGFFAAQLRLKGLDPETSAALYAKDGRSFEVRLIYSTKGQAGDYKYLEDIEFVVPVNDLALSHQNPGSRRPREMALPVNFSCDARDINSVTGCYLALEEYVGELKEQAEEASGSDLREIQSKLKSLLTTKGLVNDHRVAFQSYLQKKRKENAQNYVITPQVDAVEFKEQKKGKEKAKNYVITPQVNAAVFKAQKKLWERQQDLIDARWKPAFDKKYYKLHKDDNYDQLSNEVDILGIPEKGEKFTEKLFYWAKAKRGKAKGRLRAIQRLIGEKMRAMGLGVVEQETNRRYRQWVELDRRVRLALGQ